MLCVLLRLKIDEMINRELIRYKAVQLFYAYRVSGGKTANEAEKEFTVSLERAHDLYLYLLTLLTYIRRYAERLAENIEARNERRGLKLPTSSAERTLADNKWLLTLADNEELSAYREKNQDINDEEEALIKRLTHLFIENEDFLLYIKKGDLSPEADQEIVRRLYKTIITTCEDIESVLETRSLYWNDDKAVIDTFVLKTIKRLRPYGNAAQPLLSAWGDEQDRDFAMRLFRATIDGQEEAQELIERYSSDRWDNSRIPLMDIVILHTALAELMGVPGIPASVTINEYINVAKWYSTPQSPSFINALLDTIAKHLREEGRLMK